VSTLTVSSKGQIVLPAPIRRRLGLAAGAQLEVLEEPDGLRLRVVRSIRKSQVKALAGMVKLRARGKPRRLDDFDPASLLAKARRAKL
jgi:AbrB family looped-hinge helix DNA binding protein